MTSVIKRDVSLSAGESRHGFANGTNYTTLARNLASNIDEFCESDSGGAGAVLGICGPWGSGKTSFINQVIYELTLLPRWKEEGVLATKNCAERCTNRRILYLDPWMFNGKNDLVLQFFKELYLKYPEATETRKKLLDYGRLVLESLPDLFDFAKALSSVDSSKLANQVSRLPELFDRFHDKAPIASDAWSETSLHQARLELSECLLKDEPRLVIIDNLDRLPADEIRSVFRFIGAVINLPNLIFIVLFDRDVVLDALDGVQGGAQGGGSAGLMGEGANAGGAFSRGGLSRMGAERYLSKIISRTMNLPSVNLVDEVAKELGRIDPSLWEKRLGQEKDIVAAGIASLFRSIRDLKKAISDYDGDRFMSSSSEGTTEEFLDSCLQSFCPDVCASIERHEGMPALAAQVEQLSKSLQTFIRLKSITESQAKNETTRRPSSDFRNRNTNFSSLRHILTNSNYEDLSGIYTNETDRESEDMTPEALLERTDGTLTDLTKGFIRLCGISVQSDELRGQLEQYEKEWATQSLSASSSAISDQPMLIYACTRLRNVCASLRQNAHNTVMRTAPTGRSRPVVYIKR